MRQIALLAIAVVLCGCEATMPQQQLQPVQSGQRISIAKPVTVIENRGPLGIKLEWQLLPGDYVERYTSALGRMFESSGQLVQFTPTMGEKTRHVGGFIVLSGQAGVAKLYIVKRGEAPPTFGPLGVALTQPLIGYAGDISLVTDFPFSQVTSAAADGR
jgi:hypothetical protein